MRREYPSLALGRRPKSWSAPIKDLRRKVYYGLFAVLCITNCVALVAYLMSPDIAMLLTRQNEVVRSAFRDRIAELRIDIDRLNSVHLAQTGDVNLQLQELLRREQVLGKGHELVRFLAEMADDFVPQVGASPTDAPTVATSTQGDQELGSASEQIRGAELAVIQMTRETELAMATLSEAAGRATDEILDGLRGIGISADLASGDATGGPLFPAEGATESASMVDDANAVLFAFDRLKAARAHLDSAPIHPPLSGRTRVSSAFGNRTDPFGGGAAFHSGLDFPAPTGTLVLSPGQGVVVFAGIRGGYGNLVEIDHGDGLITRYGHLSAFLVKQGQTVRTGLPIAEVGSTGRSTGPHLHFEFRRDGKAIDPGIFLSVGRRLLPFAA